MFAPCDIALTAGFGVWETAAVAEARALFFLASWIAQTDRRTRAAFPLHLACSGDPPAGVQALAAQAGARWHSGEALGAPVQTGRLLVISADSILLRSPGAWSHVATDSALLLVSANKPLKPEPDWPAIYAAAGVPAPAERIPSARGEPMWPLFQTGTLWTADPARLRQGWAETRARVAPSCADDRAALAVARQALGGSAPLPDAFCARLALWESGALSPGATEIFQAAGLFQGMADLSEIPARLEGYDARLAAAVQAGFAARGFLERQRARLGVGRVRRLLRGLFRRHVGPALRASGAYV